MPKRNKVNRRNGTPRPRKSGRASSIPSAYRDGTSIYKSPRMVMPPEFDTSLQYHTQLLVTNIGAFAASTKYGTNAYDVDPAVGSTAMPGFTEFASLYARFRTLGIKYKFSVANQEAFPVTVIHGFSNSSIASGSVTITYAGNPLMHTSVLGPLTGQCRGIYSQKATVVKITGSSQPLFDDLYTGSTTSSTLATASTKWAYAAFVSQNAFTALGVLVTVEITLDLRFYLPVWLLS
jgi:hypothetical protein